MKHGFLLGALGYPALELIYRGRTHYSMAIAGGLATLLIEKVRRRRGGILAKALLCGAGITMLEYLCGIIWNRQYDVWDYRNQPVNLHGQICLQFTAVWCLLSAGVMALMNLRDRKRGSD